MRHLFVPTHIMPRAALKHKPLSEKTRLFVPTHIILRAALILDWCSVKKALHLPLVGERNTFRMQLIRHRVLTQMRTNDRIEIQKGHCLAVAPITSEISPPGFGRRKAGFSLLSFHGYNQHGEHYEKREKFVGLHTNLPLSKGQDSTALSTVLAFSITKEHTYDKKMGLLHEVRKLHTTVPCYYVSGIATSAPSTMLRMVPLPRSDGGGFALRHISFPRRNGGSGELASR